jgi:hypothetical protein
MPLWKWNGLEKFHDESVMGAIESKDWKALVFILPPEMELPQRMGVLGTSQIRSTMIQFIWIWKFDLLNTLKKRYNLGGDQFDSMKNVKM